MISKKDPATLTPSEINRELDSLDKKSARLTDLFIAVGRGAEPFVVTMARASKGGANDALSMEFAEISDRRMDLKLEIQSRWGDSDNRPPARCPKHLKKRKST